MFLEQIFEDGTPSRFVVTYPGRFQPFHKGHMEVFTRLQRKYGSENVFIVTGNKTDAVKSPFNFSDKVKFMHAMGVPNHSVIETDKVYDLPSQFDAIRDQVVFITVVGEPDRKRLNPGSIKKDGSPSYFQPMPSHGDKFQSADKHGYVIVEPEHPENIVIGGETYDVSHGTPCRELWNKIRNNPKQRAEYITQLYGREDMELAKTLDKIPGAAPVQQPVMKNTKKDLAKVKHDPNAVAESDISGLMTASKLNRSFIITAELAEGGTKKYRVRAQSQRLAVEKFQQHMSMAKIVDVQEEGVEENTAKGIHNTIAGLAGGFNDGRLSKGISYFLQGRHQEGRVWLQNDIPADVQKEVFAQLEKLQAQPGVNVHSNPAVQQYIDNKLLPWLKSKISSSKVAEAVSLDRSKNPNYPNDPATQKHRIDTAKALLSDPKTDPDSRREAAAILARAEKPGVAEGSGGAKYKVRSIGRDKNGDYYISPKTGKKVYKKGVAVGDHEVPNTGEIMKKVEEAGNRGYAHGFASPHAPSLGRRGREDDEYHVPDPVPSIWYIRANGKIIKNMGTPYQFHSKESARKAAMTMMAKPFNAGKQFTLTTNPVDQAPAQVSEDASNLHIGDDVIITGDVQFKGKTGVIDSFGSMNRFVVVNLYNHGKHSFHSSDVSYNDYADEENVDEDLYQYDKEDPYNSEFAPRAGMGRMTLRGWKQSLIKRTAELAQQMATAGQDIDKAALWDHVYKKLQSMNMDPIAQEIELAQAELEKIRQRGGIRSRAFNK